MEKHIVCIASEFKGNEVIEECKKQNWRVSLVTRETYRNAKWNWEYLDKFIVVSDHSTAEDYVRAASNLAGQHPIDRIIGVDEFDVLNAAKAREHLQIEGMTTSHALRFRDKLRMRNVASDAKIPCPEFVSAFYPAEINEYLERVSPPWIIKPRTEVSAFGIRKCDEKEQVWEILNALDARNTWRDHPSQYLIEKFIEGRVFHVDSVIENGKIVASSVSEYGTTPFSVAHHGGVFTTSTVDYKSKERKELEKLNKNLLKGFGHENGVAHAEFLCAAEDEKFYLLEVACRVGGAYIADVAEHACGFNLWKEWAKLTIADKENPYQKPKTRKEYAGLVLALANQETPDISAYNNEEIVYRVSKPKHVGMIFRSKKKERIEELLEQYARKITNDFLTIAPVKERHDE